MPLIKEMKVNVEDVKFIKRYLKKMPMLAARALRKAIAAEARLVLKKSQELVPVRTGTLKRSKFLKRAKARGGAVVISLGYSVKPGSYPAASGGTRTVRLDYSSIVEKGSSAFNVGFSGRFFMRKALAMTKPGRGKRIGKFVVADLKRAGR